MSISGLSRTSFGVSFGGPHMRACHLPFAHAEYSELLSKRMPMGDDLVHHGIRP